MQKKNMYVVVFMTIFSLAITALPAMARPGGPGGGPMGGGPGMTEEARQERMEARQERMRILLDLSEVQQELLQQHRTTHREKMQTLKESMHTLREQIRTVLADQDLDMPKLDELRAELRELSGQMADHRIEGILEVREILTAEQFTKFQALSPRGPRHGKGRGMGMNNEMCPKGIQEDPPIE